MAPTSSKRVGSHDVKAGKRGAAGGGDGGGRGGGRVAALHESTNFQSRSCPAPVAAPSAWDERGSLLLLVLLYMMQGVPLGLTLGTMPLMLTAKLSYTQMGIFSLAAYPYSLKLLWSPIVDGCYSRWLGRRKTWIMPVQLLSAAIMVLMAGRIETLFEAEDVVRLTVIFLMLVLLAATQDIAVDGWALELLSQHNVGYASTCQTIGSSTGYFTSFTIFLALLNPKFCNTYLRRGVAGRVLALWPFNVSPHDQELGLVSLRGYLSFWGWVFVVITLLLFFKPEADTSEEADFEDNIDQSALKASGSGMSLPSTSAAAPASQWSSLVGAYRQLLSITQLSAIWQLAAFLVTYRLGVLAAEGASNMKLVDKGVAKESLALLVLFQFPVELVSALIAGRWAASFGPSRPFLAGYFLRLCLAAGQVWVTASFPQGKAMSMASHPRQFAMLTAVSLCQSFTNTLCFTSLGSFFNSISDPVMGGTYLTLLNTLANLGYMVPRTPIFAAMDRLTVTACLTPAGQLPLLPRHLACPKKVADMLGSRGAASACVLAGGTCSLASDGYYWLAVGSLVPGLVLGGVYLLRLPRLMRLPTHRWRVAGGASGEDSSTAADGGLPAADSKQQKGKQA